MGSPPGKGQNLEPVAAAAVWGAATRAGLRPRGSCPVLGDCVLVGSLVARARPCAERYLLPPTALSPCLRAVLVPSEHFRLVNSVRFNVGVKLKSGTVIFEGRQ